MEELFSTEVTPEFYQLGDLIFSEGDEGFHFYIIESGEVEIFRKGENGKSISIAKLGPGDAFGEFALIDSVPRTASARAKTDTKVVKVSELGYRHLLDKLPPWAIAMMKTMVERIIYMNEQLTQTIQFIPSKKD